MTGAFHDAMTRATATVRRGNPMGATRIIQRALGAAPGDGPSGAIKPETPAGLLPAVRRVSHRVRGRRPRDDGRQPDAPKILRGRHEMPQGARNYRLYVPATSPAGGKPALVVMPHGCTQTPETFSTGTRMNARAGALGVHVLWPEQPRNKNRMRCWNWFETAHQAAGAGEPAILASLVQTTSTFHGTASSWPGFRQAARWRK